MPVHHAPNIDEVEAFIGRQRIRAILYVNQNQANFSAMRFADPAHVFICHGESDKDYMSSNQLKAYDRVFIAGTAARERILRKLIGFDESRLVEVGRPQVDVDFPGPSLPRDGRTVVLFARHVGGRPCRRCATPRSASHGPAMVRSLVATGRHRVIYRPHPRTGIVLRDTAAAHTEIIKVLREANHADPTAGHVVDLEGGFGWQLDASDVAVMDISAVAYDWLATAKPLLVTRPAEPRAQLPESGLVREIELLDAADAGRARRDRRRRGAPPRRGTRGARAALLRRHDPRREHGALPRRRARLVVEEREAALAARGAVAGS